MSAETRFVVIGSEARKLGKTSLACYLISSFSHFDWAAIKITSESHLAGAGSMAIHEERNAGPTDSGRFLQAGAARSYFVQANDTTIPVVVERIQSGSLPSGPVLLESTSAFRHFPDALKLLILAPPSITAKPRSQHFRDQADAYVHGGNAIPPQGKPTFLLPDAVGHSPELLDFIRKFLGSCSRG